MKADAYSTFVNMYLALDASWDECHDETLRGYLSEADPYLFKGKGSADPAAWAEFSAAYAERFPGDVADLEDAHGFTAEYLEKISDKYSKVYPGKKRLVDAFLEIAPLERWLEVFVPHDDLGK